jgi:hypothetical protein
MMAVVLGEFAVNPACICSGADVSLCQKVFGFEHGAVISDFPNGWYKDIRARFNQMPDPDRGHYLSKLLLLRDRAVARVRPSVAGDSWLEQAITSNVAHPFHAILDETESAGCRGYATAMDDENLRSGLRENKVPRNAADLVKSFLPLVVSSDRFSIIDPFIKPDPAHKNFLRELVAARRTVSKTTLYLDLHMEFDDDPREKRDGSLASKSVFKSWARDIGENLVFALHWWSDGGVGELHPRYLLTERGGVRLDRGAIVPPQLDQQDHDTDVSMLTDHFVKEVERRYSGTYRPLALKEKDTFCI